ncbi:RDD family protein [Iodobacter sp. LRB]|uniref:RDD family protein n=1 Tax=unclassified Iodobacter TaxID=235634 RepID=UPI000C11441C|nr:RDD family protein [Iodobacter sp. BJB302]PHV02197.1 hypothetical protein CSQ88_07930 [Iodobacter sp. BJB302]
MQYPSIFRRYTASLIDFLVVLLILWAISNSPLEPLFHESAFGLFIVLLLCYEPIATVLACSLGQYLMRFRVRNHSDLSRISGPQAYGRFFIKCSLGIVSLLLIPARKDRRAIHDVVAKTIVIEAKSPLLLHKSTPR